MAQLIVYPDGDGANQTFNLLSTWAISAAGVRTSGPSTANKTQSYTFSDLPAGAKINSITAYANVGSPLTGISVLNANGVKMDEIDRTTRLRAASITFDDQQTTTKVTYSFKANGDTTYRNGAKGQASLSFKNLYLLIDYTEPVPEYYFETDYVQCGDFLFGTLSLTEDNYMNEYEIEVVFGNKSVSTYIDAQHQSGDVEISEEWNSIEIPFDWAYDFDYDKQEELAYIYIKTIIDGAVVSTSDPIPLCQSIPSYGSLMIDDIVWSKQNTVEDNLFAKYSGISFQAYISGDSFGSCLASSEITFYNSDASNNVHVVKSVQETYLPGEKRSATISAVLDSIPYSGELWVVVSYHDSRGNGASLSDYEIGRHEVQSWTPLSISSAKVGRCNADGTTNPSGVDGYLVVNYSQSKYASVKMYVQYANEDIVETREYRDYISGAPQVFTSNDLALDKPYQIQIRLEDQMTQVSVQRSLGTAYSYMRWEPQNNAIGFGCYPSKSNCVEIASDWDLIVAGAPVLNEAGVLYDALYDTKTEISYEYVSGTASIYGPAYKNSYSSSVFSGWTACCGNPQNFDLVKFPITVRDGYPISTITVRVYEMPPISEVSELSNGVSPKPNTWTKQAEASVLYSEQLPVGVTIVEAAFKETVANENGSYLFLEVLCDNLVTMGLVEKTYDDIAYNGWAYYSTNGSLTRCTALTPSSNTPYIFSSTTVLCIACEFQRILGETTYDTIGTEKNDKFFELVNDCINNSDAFSELFEETEKATYLCGSRNLTSTTATSVANATSTFTGVIFPIGVLPKTITSDGCMLQVSARSFNDSTAAITKVWAFLYAVETLPLASENYYWDDLEPTLLRTGSCDCECPIGESQVVTVRWTEGAFTNEEGKFLMLGYSCDTYNNRCFSGVSGADVCGSIDGNTYAQLDTWYSTTKDGTASWRPHWIDSNANAWSICELEKVYSLGDNFYDVVESVVAETQANVPPTSEVRLAAQYDLVVGDTFQLFYSGVIKSFDAEHEGVTVRCSKGKEYPRYWEYTPNDGDEGTYTLTLYTRQLDGSVISQGSTKIVVHSKLTNDTTPSNLTCLIFGDSLTSAGTWAAEGLRRIYGADTSVSPATIGITNTVTTYGSKSNTHNGFKVYHEGYGGWTWNSFLTAERGSDSTTNGIIVTLAAAHGYTLDVVQKSIWTDNNGLLWELEDLPSDTQIKFNRGEGNNSAQSSTSTPTSQTCETLGYVVTPSTIVWETTNPFYDEATESLDFVAHAEEHGASTPDIVACLLTWNGGGGTLNFDQEKKIAVHISKATQLLRAIHEDCPNAKIITMGIQLPSLTGGTGNNYGANGGYADRYSTIFYAFDYNKALEELVTNSEFGEYCYYVDTKGQFDSLWNMPYTTKPVNTRSTITEYLGTNGVHPTINGYYQIGDAFYRALSKIIPLVASGT